MSALTQPLRDEHRELLPQIERLRAAADAVGEAPPGVLREQVDEAYEFLVHHLIPHAEAEDRALYPVVGRVMGAPQATATMSRDHVEVGRLTAGLAMLRTRLRIGDLPEADRKALRRVLYGLYALVQLHFAKEEEIYLPLLDARLTPEEARAMFAAMEGAAREARVQPPHLRARTLSGEPAAGSLPIPHSAGATHTGSGEKVVTRRVKVGANAPGGAARAR